MINFFRKILRPKYEPLNRIEIIKQNLLDNFAYLSSLQRGAEIFPVLKSNAYGHGLKELAKILNKTSTKMVAVDSFPEAQIVYKNFKGRVLFLNEMPLKAYNYCLFKRSEFCVYNSATLKYLAKHHSGVKIHLFYNSGMNREGISDLQSFLDENNKYLNRVQIVGFCSHLMASDTDPEMTSKQESNFMAALDILQQNKIFPTWIHLGNSAGIFVLRNKRLTAFRAGLALYGYSPLVGESEVDNHLKPALRVVSTIIARQALKRGDKVSYNGRYEAQGDTQIALVPFGYYEGLDRRLSNEAQFLVHGKKDFLAKVAGTISMNLVCLDAGDYQFKIGDRVELVSPDNNSVNSIKNLSNISRTIPYEQLVRLQGNIHRQVI
ncbi:MAG: alanine racemase [Patescibacteria group bacterium]